MDIKSKVLDIKENLNNDEYKKVEISVFYSLGGVNYFTGKAECRGYYLSAQKVNISNGFKSFTIMGGQDKGFKLLLKEVKRRLKSYENNIDIDKIIRAYKPLIEDTLKVKL